VDVTVSDTVEAALQSSMGEVNDVSVDGALCSETTTSIFQSSSD